MYTLEQIEKLIDQQGFTWCTVLNGNSDKVAYFAKKKGNDMSANDLKAALKTFYADFPGTYNLHFKQSPTGSAEDIHKYRSVSAGTIQIGQKPVDIEAMRQDLITSIRKELKAETKKEEEARKIKELKEEYESKIAELNTVGGKVNHLLETFLLKMMGNANATGSLAGTENNNTPMDNTNNYTQDQIKMANESLVILLKHMDPQTLYQFALKVESKPSIVDLLKTYL
jgi:hypothetical protein